MLKHSSEGKTKTTNNTLSHTRKILILADSHGRNLSSIVREKLPSKFSVTGIFKPSATMAHVIENLHTHTRSFTQQDTVIIMGGQNDINSGSHFDTEKHLTKNTGDCQIYTSNHDHSAPLAQQHSCEQQN